MIPPTGPTGNRRGNDNPDRGEVRPRTAANHQANTGLQLKLGAAGYHPKGMSGLLGMIARSDRLTSVGIRKKRTPVIGK
jgi:hypothetical protein